MKQDKITINLIQNTVITKSAEFENKDKAKVFYETQSQNQFQYVQLVINKQKYTTAEAERYFGAKAYESRQLKFGR